MFRFVCKPSVLGLSLVLVLAGSSVAAFAVGSPVDDSGDGIAGPAGIQTLSASSDGATIFVDLTLAADRDDQTKYRIHFDYLDPKADDNPDCVTTSDDTSMLRGVNDKQTGPGIWVVTDGSLLSLEVPYSELGVGSGDSVFIWADTHWKGIQDRAPDTDDFDGCSKPQSTDEVLELTLN